MSDLGVESREVPKPAKSFRTSQGSVYTYDEEGKTIRFKTATNETQIRQDITVFVDLSLEEEQRFLRAYHHPPGEDQDQKIYVLERQPDDTPKIIRDRKEIKYPDSVYLGILKKGEVLGLKKASLVPMVGYNVFDTRHYKENDESKTERHLGNKVVSIEY